MNCLEYERREPLCPDARVYNIAHEVLLDKGERVKTCEIRYKGSVNRC